MKIAGVVTLFYPKDKDIENIYNYLSEVDKLFVIDNTPTNEDRKKLFKDKKIEYFHYHNIGVSKALNIACEQAINESFKWILTMDQDTVIEPIVINSMKRVIKDVDISKIGIVTPFHKTKLNVKKPTKKIDYPQDVMTSANLVNLNIWQEVGGFIDYFFIDGIDIEYGLRLKSYGYKIMRLNYLEVNHDLGDIFYIGNKLCTNHSGIRRYYMNRNYHYIYDMYYETDREFVSFLVSNYKTMLKVILFERHKFSKVYGFILGYIHYKRNIKGKLEKFLFKKL